MSGITTMILVDRAVDGPEKTPSFPLSLTRRRVLARLSAKSNEARRGIATWLSANVMAFSCGL